MGGWPKTNRLEILHGKTKIADDPAGFQMEINLDAAFVFTFNQPMDSASTQQNLAVVGPDGAQIAGKYSWNPAGSELTFQPDRLLERSSQYQVKYLPVLRRAAEQAWARIYPIPIKLCRILV